MSRYCRCGTALAADNRTRLCGACQTTREGGAPDVPAEFWQTDVMAAALDSGDLGRVLRAYRCHPYHRQRVSPELVPHWTRLMGLLDDQDASLGSHDVLPAVRRELGLIVEHRNVARGVLRTDLLRVEARWSQFASYLAHDADDERMADYWADRASRLAEEGDYPDMVARVLVRRSQWAVAGFDAQPAVAFAQAARNISGTSDQIRALCAMKEADAHALADDADACERSLADARAFVDRADTPRASDVAGHELAPHYLLAAEARCWLWLQPHRAIAMYDDAVRRWPHHRTRSRGVHQSRLALACVGADEPERAVTEGIKALEIARTRRSKVIQRDLARLDQRLAACDVPAAADFHEALATL